MAAAPSYMQVRLWSSPSRRRLAGSLWAYERELEGRLKHWRRKGPAHLRWVPTAKRLIQDAKQALKDGTVDAGWKLLHAARRMEVYGHDRDQLEATADGLLHEATQKLSSSRLALVQSLLEKRPVAPDRLYEAVLTRDEHFANLYHRIDLLQSQMLTLAGLVGLILAGFLEMAAMGQLPLGAAADVNGLSSMRAVMLSGALGGAVSALMATSHTRADARIPDMILTKSAALTRVVLGAAAAVAVTFFLDANVLEFSPTTLGQVLAIGFAFGFTERFVVSSAAALAHKSSK
jgi:hypothetical protein